MDPSKLRASIGAATQDRTTKFYSGSTIEHHSRRRISKTCTRPVLTEATTPESNVNRLRIWRLQEHALEICGSIGLVAVREFGRWMACGQDKDAYRSRQNEIGC